MPDQDIFNKRFAKGWGGPARKICRGDNPKNTAEATARALRHDLKETGGIPDLPELHSMLIKAQKGANPKAVYQLFQELKQYERNSINRNLFDSEKKAIIQIYLEFSERNNRHRTLFPTKQQLTEKILENYIVNQLDSKIEISDDSEIAGSWTDENYQEYNRQLNRRKKEIAKSLVKDPNFKKPPRFKAVKKQRISTEKLLHKPIPLE